MPSGVKKHISHFNLEEAVAQVQQLKIPGLFHSYKSSTRKHDDVNAELPPGISLGWDKLEINV
jgi:phosphoribosyl 1,2-cyclic phosphate phosphodiesterase